MNLNLLNKRVKIQDYNLIEDEHHWVYGKIIKETKFYVWLDSFGRLKYDKRINKIKILENLTLIGSIGVKDE